VHSWLKKFAAIFAIFSKITCCGKSQKNLHLTPNFLNAESLHPEFSRNNLQRNSYYAPKVSFFFFLCSFFFEYILILPFCLKKKTFHIQKISGNSQHGKSENGIFLSKLRCAISAVARAVQELRRMEHFGGRNRGKIANENFR
jgi:hypothetical protein